MNNLTPNSEIPRNVLEMDVDNLTLQEKIDRQAALVRNMKENGAGKQEVGFSDLHNAVMLAVHVEN